MPAALAIARHQFRGREALSALFLSPLMIPHVVLGIAFLRFFTQIGVLGTFPGLLIAHVVIVFPFALRLTLAAATGMDRSIEMAALSLGAGSWTLFRRVTLPLILPGVVSGGALAFIQSFDEVTMTVFLAAPGIETLPVRMFLYIQTISTAGNIGLRKRDRDYDGCARPARPLLRPGAGRGHSDRGR